MTQQLMTQQLSACPPIMRTRVLIQASELQVWHSVHVYNPSSKKKKKKNMETRASLELNGFYTSPENLES